MKKVKLVFAVIIMAVFVLALQSCGDGDLTSSPEGFVKLESMLKSEFSDGAFYTNISIVTDKNVGTMINTTVTKDPSSLKMEEWNRLRGVWTQSSEVTLELGSGKAEDFMFTLSDVSLAKVGELVVDAKKRLKDEKDIDDTVVRSVSIVAPNDGDKSKMTYSFGLIPKNGGTDFNFTYGIDGKFQDMTY